MKTAEEILKECTDGFEHSSRLKYDILEAMKLYANQKLNEAATKSKEMIYERSPEHSQKQGLVLRNFQTCYAVDKQSILSLKDKI